MTAWQRIILVRSLVLEPTSAVDIVVKFANLCRKARRYKLAKSALDSVVIPDEEVRHSGRALAQTHCLCSCVAFLKQTTPASSFSGPKDTKWRHSDTLNNSGATSLRNFD